MPATKVPGQLVDPDDPSQLRSLLIAYCKRVERAESQLAVARPKATAYDEFVYRRGEVSIDDAAKMLFGWSGQKLFKTLRKVGWIDRRNGTNTPNLWTIEKGYMAVRPATLPNGRAYSQPVLTPKGCSTLRLAVREKCLFP